MKKALQWLDENLEEVLLVIALAAMAVIMGNTGHCKIYIRASLSSVGRTDPVYIYLGRIPECELLYEKNVFLSRSSSLLRFSQRGEKPFSKE